MTCVGIKTPSIFATMPTSWFSVVKAKKTQMPPHIGMGESSGSSMRISIIRDQGRGHQIPKKWSSFGYAGSDTTEAMTITKDGEVAACRESALWTMKKTSPLGFSIQPSLFEPFISSRASPLAGRSFIFPEDLSAGSLKKRTKTGICFMLICLSILIYDVFLLNLSFRFVDRDMFMRFRGGGVGHKSIQKKIHKFCNDRWPDENIQATNNSQEARPTDDNEEVAAAQPEASSRVDPSAEEAAVAQPEASSLVDPSADDIELPEEEAESDSEDTESDSEDAGDEEGSEEEADETNRDSGDDLEYADY